LRAATTELSYEHVIADIRANEPKTKNPDKLWDFNVSAVKDLLATNHFNRMAIAQLAIEATIIRLGGDRHSEKFKETLSQLTVTKFATATGINKSTLWLWIQIKKTVFDVLPEKQQNFRHDVGEQTFKTIGAKRIYPQEVVAETYDRFDRTTKPQKAALRLFKYVMAIKKFFTRTDFWTQLTDDQLNALRTSLAQILKRVVEIQDIRAQKTQKENHEPKSGMNHKLKPPSPKMEPGGLLAIGRIS